MGNSSAYRTFGWSGQEDSYVWTVGGQSGLTFPPPVEPGPLVLDLDFTICLVEPLLAASAVRVFVNGQSIGSARVRGRTRLRCFVPAAIVPTGKPIELRLEHPCFVRMGYMDFGTESRPLGLCFYAIFLYPPWLRAAAELIVPKPYGCSLIEAATRLLPEAAEPHVRTRYCFNRTDREHLHLDSGWRYDEQGNARADARICHVEVPPPPTAGHYFARFGICPLYSRNILQAQRINILLSGAMIGQFRTGTDTSFTVYLPPELIQPGGVLRFSFVVPDGLALHELDPDESPHFESFLLDWIDIESGPPRHAALTRLRYDDVAAPEPIAMSEKFLTESVDELNSVIRDTLGIGVAEILLHFESLGDNCAFGLAQRKGGCEVMTLLRFANTPLAKLVSAFDDQFRVVGDADQITMRWVPGNPGEFVLYAEKYGIRWHTNVFDRAADEDQILAQQTMRLSYLRRKFFEGLSAGRKIYTIYRAEPLKHPIPLPDADERKYWEEKPEPLRLAEILSLLIRLNQYGANTLLYLTPCERNRRSGTVELIAPGIMRGYVDDFVITPDIETKDHAAWLRVAANAWLLDKGPNASFRNKPAS